MTGAVLGVPGLFATRRVAPPHLPHMGEARTPRPVPEVTPIRPADRVTVYQLRPDGRLEMVELSPARRADEAESPPSSSGGKLGSRLDLYA